MKKIFLFVMLVGAADCFAAQTPFGDIIQQEFPSDSYLVGAADAWHSVLGTGGEGAAVYADLNKQSVQNKALFSDMIANIAYNQSDLTQCQVRQNVSVANANVLAPLEGRKGRLGDIDISVVPMGWYSEYEKGKNSDFKTRNMGVRVDASGFITDGFALGMSYARINTNTRRTAIYSDATSDIITLFSKYLSESGLFLNIGIDAGQINWTDDKAIAGIKNSSAFDTDFVAGQINTGIQFNQGRFYLVPQIGTKYIRLKSDKHIDAAAQEFEKWWYNTLTGVFDVDIGFDVFAQGFLFRPIMKMGIEYDFLTNGTDNISVRVLGGNMYYVPINTPHRMAFVGGLGISMNAQWFVGQIMYELDLRSNYISHTGKINLKMGF